jgi:hypothetical protein
MGKSPGLMGQFRSIREIYFVLPFQAFRYYSFILNEWKSIALYTDHQMPISEVRYLALNSVRLPSFFYESGI